MPSFHVHAIVGSAEGAVPATTWIRAVESVPPTACTLAPAPQPTIAMSPTMSEEPALASRRTRAVSALVSNPASQVYWFA